MSGERWRVFSIYTAEGVRYFVGKSPDYTKRYKNIFYQKMEDAESLRDGLNQKEEES